MTLIILDAAEREFNASVDYYEARETGLGIRFRTEAETVFERILRHPELPRLRRGLYIAVSTSLRSRTTWPMSFALT
jgi:plasmid stabilization system protein ParE